jgi:hypothetical protein
VSQLVGHANRQHRIQQPVGLLLLSVQLAVGLLELVRQQLQVASQLVISFELLRHQYQIACGVMQWNVADVEAPPAHRKQTKTKRGGLPVPGKVVQIHHAGVAKKHDQIGLGNVQHLPLQTQIAILGRSVHLHHPRPGLEHVDGVDVRQYVLEGQLQVGADLHKCSNQ